jgi:hypothetical protein
LENYYFKHPIAKSWKASQGEKRSKEHTVKAQLSNSLFCFFCFAL